ncbi:hypothetical protein BJX64DRAFT_262027 [Aspergillus heterothallicus]
MKWTDRSSVKEAVAMQVAGSAGMPVLKVISSGEHIHATFKRSFSILITTLPGIPLGNSNDTLQIEIMYHLYGIIVSSRFRDDLLSYYDLMTRFTSSGSWHGFLFQP